MTIGQISYTNTKPFFYEWPADQFPIISGSPRELAHMARNGKITAAPLPIVECWRLEKTFEPLGNWGIAVNQASNSVFLLSKKPIGELDNVTIGVTTESYTSVALCELIINQKYGHQVTIKRGFGEDDAGWLVIGDQALQYWTQTNLGRWSYRTDLATEWWDWKNLPCVFAQWVVRKDLGVSERTKLENQITSSLAAGKKAISEIAIQQDRYLKISSEKIEQYLRGFTYEFGCRENDAAILFRKMVEENSPNVLTVRQ